MNVGFHKKLVKYVMRGLQYRGYKIISDDRHRVIFCMGMEELIIVKSLKDGYFTAYFCKDRHLQYVFRSERLWIKEVYGMFLNTIEQRKNQQLAQLVNEQISSF